MYKKILGCLLGAAVGDAMGAATETRTRQQIEETFGGYVTEFLTPPGDTFARGSRAGQVTDDFSVAYVTLQEILKSKRVDEETAIAGLLKWAAVPEYFDRFAGPTTRAMVKELQGQKPGVNVFAPVNENNKATNGGAMKAAPIALLAKGDIDQAIEKAVTVCRVTHNNNIALAGAAAVAAATAAAMKEGANLYDVVKASLYGAVKGDQMGSEQGATLAGASMEARIRWAVSVAMTQESLDESLPDVKCLIFLNGGERIIYVIPTEKRDLVPNVMEMETLHSADYVYTTVGELNCFRDPASLMESLKAHGVTVVLDVEYISDENRQAEWELIQRAGILFINAEGDRHLLEKISENYKEDLCRRGCMAVVTDGEHGCTIYGTDGAIVKSGAYQVKPVDTTGAGDTFNTSFLYGLSYGMSLEEAGNFANGAAARSILYMGPRSGAVGEDAVWEFINHWKAFW